MFSFIDIKAYKKVQRHLLKYSEHFAAQYDSASIEEAEPTAEQVEEFAGYLSKIRSYWQERGWDLEICVCAEKFDLSHHGMLPSKCIDAELMLKLFGNDPAVTDYLTKAPTEKSFEIDQLNLFSALPTKRKRSSRLKRIRGSGRNADVWKAKISACTTRVCTGVSIATQIVLRN